MIQTGLPGFAYTFRHPALKTTGDFTCKRFKRLSLIAAAILTIAANLAGQVGKQQGNHDPNIASEKALALPSLNAAIVQGNHMANSPWRT